VAPIVVLNTHQPVAMPWLGHVKALLNMWFPGDEGGWATANVLLGKVNPAGRLPFTWPATFSQGPANDPLHQHRATGPRRCSQLRCPLLQFAVRSLAAFDRVKVGAGQSRRVTLDVDERELSYWSTSTHRWTLATGSRTLYVGTSSRDFRLTKDL
jgi:hypothetical protein